MSSHNLKYLFPEKADIAYDMFRGNEGAVFLAGGTDYVPLLKLEVKRAACIIGLEKIKAFKKIEERNGSLFIGSMVTLGEMLKSTKIREAFPALLQSACAVATPQIRNIGTIGGNVLQERRCMYFNQISILRQSLPPCFKLNGEVCHQIPGSKNCVALYYSDLAPVLLAYDTRVEVHEEDGIHLKPLQQIISEHIQETRSPILIKGFLVPYPPELTWAKFYKDSVRRAIDFSTLNLAIRYSPNPEKGNQEAQYKIIVGAISPEPIEIGGTGAYQELDQSRLMTLKNEMVNGILREVKKKSAPIKETTTPLKVKIASQSLIKKALDELFFQIQTTGKET